VPNNYLFWGVLIILVVLLVIHLLSRYESLHPPRRRSAPPPPQVEQVPPAPPPPAEPEPDPVQSPEDLFCQPIYEKYVEGRFSHLLAIAIQGVVMEQSAAVSVVEKALGARNAYRQSAKYLDYMLEAGVIAENQYGDRRVVITPGQARQIILPQLMEYPAAWSVSEVVEQLRKDIAFMLSDFWTGVDTMSGTEFEAWCMELLKKMGFEHVESTKATGDQGVDILAEKDEVPYAFQCKCYATDLGNTPVQEVYAGLRYYHRNVGVVITNRYFTTGAKALAKATDVLLWDRDRLKRIIQATEKQ